MVPMEPLDPNLLASPRRQSPPPPTINKENPASAPAKSKRRRFAKNLALSAVGLVSFLFFVLLKIPDASVTGYALNALSQALPAYNVNAQKISWGLLLGPKITIDGLEVTPRFGAGPKIAFDTITVKPSLLRMFPWKGTVEPAASFSAKAFSGKIEGSFKQGVETDLEVFAKSIELGKIEALTDKVAVEGALETLNLFLAHDGRWSHATGQFNILGRNLRLDPASLNLGLPLPILDLGNLVLIGRIQNGKGVVERLTLGETGKDLEAQAQGIVHLKEPVLYSDIDLQIKFRVSEKIMRIIPSLDNMLNLFAAKRPDGFYGTRVKGPLLGLSMPTPWKE